MNTTTPTVPTFERPPAGEPVAHDGSRPEILPEALEPDPWAQNATEVDAPESPTFWPPLPVAPAPSAPPEKLSPTLDPRLRRGARLVFVALLAGVTGSALTLALTGDDVPGSATRVAVNSPAAPSSVLSGEGLDVAGVVAAVEPATVSIEANYENGNGTFGSVGAGTGVILTAEGEVLTNAHVVDGASAIRVTLAGEAQSREADLVGADTGADLALVRIRNASGLPTVQLGSSSQVRVGDDVVAIGNALALKGGPTVTRGIISALDRSLEADGTTMTGLIQTDASISSGNSGGPLVNALGQVVAINTAVATGGRSSSAENIGFAIPIDKALPVVERLRSGTEASALAYLGVRTADPVDGSRGATVVSVDAGSPAASGGLRAGDLVTQVAGKAVVGAAELGGVVQEHKPGEQVDVTVIRRGDPVTLQVTLGTRPPG